MKILLTLLLNLGDVARATAAVAAIRKQWCDAEITVLIRKQSEDIVKDNKLFDHYYVVDYKSKSYGGILDFSRVIRKNKYDMAICLDQRLRSLLYCRLAGIKDIVLADGVFKYSKFAEKLLAHRVIRAAGKINSVNPALLLNSVIEQLIAAPVCKKTYIGELQPDDFEKARELLAFSCAPQKIALCVKSTFGLKDWPQVRFAELIRKLASKGADCYIIGVSSDYDYAQEIIDMSGIAAKNFCGLTTIKQMLALLRLSDALISVDTGTVHVAAAVDVPQVVIFGCTAPFCYPLTEKCLTVSSYRGCCPCSKKVEECSERYCLNEISVEDVLLAVDALIY